MSIVRRAYDAFCRGDYEMALDNYQQAGNSIGHKFFSANTQLCRNRYWDVNSGRVLREPNRKLCDESGQLFSDSLVVALVADEFTSNSFSNVFQALYVNPDNWRELFDTHQPDIFFCESAWSGTDSEKRPWKGQVYASCNFKRENRSALLDIISYCRTNGIPTIFWNKEDPTHHDDKVHDFVKTAKEFDFVFTTAEECEESYRTVHGVNNVWALPFATNPLLFNPVENQSRSSSIVFAGSWYGNHQQRCIDMESILDSIITDGFDVEIYDRFYGGQDELHCWPQKYQKMLKPSKPHALMPDVYKSSKFGLNFNTVKNSKTMFARRVFELMSSNTLVVSNFSQGTNNLFGDLIVYPDVEPGRLRSLSDSQINNLRQRALDLVLSEHTYKNRWNTILNKIGFSCVEREVSITVAVKVNDRLEARKAVAWYQLNQVYLPGSRLLLIASESMSCIAVAELYQEFNRFNIAVTSCSHIKHYAVLGRYFPIETSHFVSVVSGKFPDLMRIRSALLHLQYMNQFPISLTDVDEIRYSIKTIDSESLIIDSASELPVWLLNAHLNRMAYLV
ncbi:glycosyltransferase [Aquitalea sp. USM4]|uniref:CgeB family protein n=1 Tax=Aquitalea sp. USM4 TaxID=1590041 RepID=UPI00103C20D0|nr:glycosyltransferase [Aquitalea sp. USM4]QBJ78605.1 hypothetical protein DKK66_11290 [Aquitalea sp. USM4]